MKITFSGRFHDEIGLIQKKLSIYPIELVIDGDGLAFTADLPETTVREVIAIVDSVESQHFLLIGG